MGQKCHPIFGLVLLKNCHQQLLKNAQSGRTDPDTTTTIDLYTERVKLLKRQLNEPCLWTFPNHFSFQLE